MKKTIQLVKRLQTSKELKTYNIGLFQRECLAGISTSVRTVFADGSYIKIIMKYDENGYAYYVYKQYFEKDGTKIDEKYTYIDIKETETNIEFISESDFGSERMEYNKEFKVYRRSKYDTSDNFVGKEILGYDFNENLALAKTCVDDSIQIFRRSYDEKGRVMTLNNTIINSLEDVEDITLDNNCHYNGTDRQEPDIIDDGEVRRIIKKVPDGIQIRELNLETFEITEFKIPETTGGEMLIYAYDIINAFTGEVYYTIYDPSLGEELLKSKRPINSAIVLDNKNRVKEIIADTKTISQKYSKNYYTDSILINKIKRIKESKYKESKEKIIQLFK